jgi:pimeloyl-ACP methyl ester carboxylesterase
VGAAGGVRDLLGETLQHLAPDLTRVVLSGCGHYVPEEQPIALTLALLRLFGGAE